ncbi:MAG: stage V sporulation protein S [Candidatus Asgardarchaeia archaeon]
MTDDMERDGEIDVALLLVSGSKGSKEKDKEYVKKLSNAVLQVFYKHDIVRLRCVGAASLNNAIKAFIIAKGEAQKKGDSLVLDPSFTTVKFQGIEKTGIVLEGSSR